MKTPWLHCFSFFLCFCCVTLGASAEPHSTEVGDLTIHHSVFSSTAIKPEIAERHGLVRGKDYILVNIAVVPKATPGSAIPAVVSGSATNLMQQRKNLEFAAIEEPGTTYYIATLRTTNEEIFHFLIDVLPEGHDQPIQIKFSKKLFVNE